MFSYDFWFLNFTFYMESHEGLLDIQKSIGIIKNEISSILHRVISHLCPFTCSVCGQRVRRFDPLDDFYAENKRRFGNPYGPDDVETINAQQYSCPYCKASDRDRLCALFLNRKIGELRTNESLFMLDIAPSKPLREFIKQFDHVKYRCADLSMNDVDDNIDVMDMHIYPNESFDAFICSHVLEHVADDKKALSELFRILHPNGWGILMVPINLVINQIDEDPSITDVGERWRRFGQHDHVRLYSKQGFIDRVEKEGFDVNQFGVGYFGRKVFSVNGITKKSILYVVYKR